MSQFINPYNFIPLQAGVAKDSQDDKYLSGVIEYRLMTRTPLFVPNTSNDHAIKQNLYREDGKFHKSYEFFAYEDLSETNKAKTEDELLPPVIPASEIRGMLRSQYEIITNSCMSVLEDEVLSKRTAEVFKAGLIERKSNDSFVLYEAEDCLLRTNGADDLVIDQEWDPNNPETRRRRKYDRKCFVQSKLHEGAKVKVSYIDRGRNGKALISSVNSKGDTYNGYLIKGEDGPEMKDRWGNTMKNQKHCAHVFLKKGNRSMPIDSRVLDLVLLCYKNNEEHTYSEYASEWTKFKSGKGAEYFPVYYSKGSRDGSYIMMSPAAITREVYENNITKMIRGHQPCTDKNNLCPACSLFGTLTNGFSNASRIRFTDLIADEFHYEKPIMLKELSSPKLGNIEFYLQRPKEALFWTYDYYIDKNGNVISNVPVVNGRKIYWHNIDMKLDDARAGEETERNITIRPVGDRSYFKGKLYFDKISKKELEALIYLLETGDSDTLEKKRHGYKLGSAKPLGFGSVAISIDHIDVRKIVIDHEKKNISIKKEAYQIENLFAIEDINVREAFKKSTDFTVLAPLVQRGYQIAYPHIKNGTDDTIFNWFVQNHKAYKYDKRTGQYVDLRMPNARVQMYYKEYLEAGTPEFVSTDALDIVNANNKSNSNNQNFQKNKSQQQYKGKNVNNRYRGR